MQVKQNKHESQNTRFIPRRVGKAGGRLIQNKAFPQPVQPSGIAFPPRAEFF
jgi:hypothetical protein